METRSNRFPGERDRNRRLDFRPDSIIITWTQAYFSFPFQRNFFRPSFVFNPSCPSLSLFLPLSLLFENRTRLDFFSLSLSKRRVAGSLAGGGGGGGRLFALSIRFRMIGSKLIKKRWMLENFFSSPISFPITSFFFILDFSIS